MLQFLSKIDLFGAEEKLQIHSLSRVQKSRVGGLMTIILYGVSFAYFLSELIDWTNNNKIPKLTSLRTKIGIQETAKFPGRYFEIQQHTAISKYDPFDPSNSILVPLVLVYAENTNFEDYFLMQFETIKQVGGNSRHIFYLSDDQIIGSSSNSSFQGNTKFQIQLIQCQILQKYIELPSIQCADQEIIDEYINQQKSMIELKFFLTEFDTKSRKLYHVERICTVLISPNTQKIYDFFLEPKSFLIEDGIILSNINKFSVISDYQFEIQQFNILVPNDLWDEVFVASPLILVLKMSGIKTITTIEYPKISEIFANTGAIISWILQISYLVSKYNEKLCFDQTMNTVINMYFPDFQNLKIKRNWKGKILSANILDKFYDPQKIDTLIRKLTHFVQSKVCYINVQYEISRLQFLLTKQLGIACIKNCVETENRIENFLDTLDYRIKSMDGSSINISQEQSNIASLQELKDPLNCEIYHLESSIGLLNFKPPLVDIKQPNQTIDLHIVPKECLQQEDVSKMNSPH